MCTWCIQRLHLHLGRIYSKAICDSGSATVRRYISRVRSFWVLIFMYWAKVSTELLVL